MSLSARDAFKVGFIKQCRDEGLSDDQIFDRAQQLIKQAGKDGTLAGLANNWNQGIENAGEHKATLHKALIAAGIGVPFLGGAALGALGSRLKGDFTNEEDVKNQEVVEELRRQTALAKQHSRLKALTPAI